MEDWYLRRMRVRMLDSMRDTMWKAEDNRLNIILLWSVPFIRIQGGNWFKFKSDVHVNEFSEIN